MGAIEAALARLGRVLPDGAPELFASLRPPAGESEIAALRDAVVPYDLPLEVEALLRWADGQDGGPWWPPLRSGPLLSAAGMARTYRFLRDETEDWQWSPLWLPVMHEGWCQAGVEMTADRPGAVVVVEWGGYGTEVVAPTLTAAIEAASDVVEAGIPPTNQPVERETARAHEAARRELLSARSEWRAWPYDRVIAPEVGAWPPHWRESIGLPPDPTCPRLPAQPIASVIEAMQRGFVEATIEGYITDRVLIDGQASGDSIITLDDGTGTMRVLVEPGTPGRYWAAWLNARIQVDVGGGGAGRNCDGLAAEVRVGVQTGAPAPSPRSS